MKVLQITPVAPPQKSGMANAAGEIYKATSGLGLDVSLVSAFGDSTVPGLKHWHVPGAGFLAFTPKLTSLVKDCDIIHLHYPCYGNAFLVDLALRKTKKPLIVSYHMDTVGRGLRKPVFAFHARFLAPRFLRRAASIVVASRDYAEHSLLAKYPELMAKVVEIPFGVDAKRFTPTGTKHAKTKNILFVAALDEQHYFKGLNYLLEAMPLVSEAKLVVVGDGNLRESYVRRAGELGISDRVVFAGRVSDAELPKYFEDADVFCSASVDRSEAYGMVLMEAAAAGLPAVATDIPGVRTVVKNNETGVLVPPKNSAALAEALNTILNNVELKTRLGLAARDFALSRTWSDAGKKYLEIYKAASK